MPTTNNCLPRRLLMPTAAASTNAKTAPTVAIDSIDTSDTDGLRDPAQFFLEINEYQLVTLPAVTVPFGIQD
jgi:hypothetical protein